MLRTVHSVQKSFALCRTFTSTCALSNHLDSKTFSKTLLLPKTSFPLWSEPSKSEVPFRARTCEDLYRWQRENTDGAVFVLHDGPPYANGNLHMGHALNKILKDIINRFHVSRGRKVHYVPGWDCHGLPIENKALQELGQDSASTSASMIRSAAHNTAVREVASQRDQFYQFGIMADWSTSSTYRTLDHAYEMRQLRIFQTMVEKGLIYRHYRPVHYSPSSRSALAEAELVYKDDHVSHSVFVAFDLDMQSINNHHLRSLSAEKIQLLVWTTTPWTLTANMGISVHRDLTYSVLRRANGNSMVIVAKERVEALQDILGDVEAVVEVSGSDLVGLAYRPIFSSFQEGQSLLNVIPASHVTSDSGTGLVHCAPAHGAEDYNAFRNLGLLAQPDSIICHVDAQGNFSKDVVKVVGDDAGKSLIGQPVLDAGSRAVVELLKQTKSFVAIKRFKHRYPYDWKTDKPIIVTATSQWFANLDNIKANAMLALRDVNFFPPASRNRLEAFIRSRSEWCISRQRVWGVPIPALYHVPSDRAVLDSKSLDHILSILDKKGSAYWWEGPVEEFLHPDLLEQEAETKDLSKVWRKGTDTMDVWFDSGTSWSMLDVMGVGRDPKHGRKWDADVCLEGSDQHRGWFQSQLLTAVSCASSSASSPQSPYGTLITHGMVLDEKGKKMSKSLGNIINPLTVVHGGKDKKKEPAYGADILRLWAGTVEYWNDMSIGPTSLSQTAESMRRIRNSARFMLGNIGDKETRSSIQRVNREKLGLAERYVMNELFQLEKIALENYGSYNFPKVMNTLVNFANITLSSLYFDFTKDCLYADSVHSLQRRAIVTVLEKILETMTSVLAPVMPHLAEEIHQSYHNSDTSFFQKKWLPLGTEWEDLEAQKEMNQLLKIRKTVLSLLEEARGRKQLKSSLEAEIDIIVPDDIGTNAVVDLLRREEPFLKTLFIVSDATLTDEGSLGTTSPAWVYSDSVSISGITFGIRVRPSTLLKCPRCWTFTRVESESVCGRCSSVLNL
ncbi:isoleucyl-tRNA synthetase [Dendrothele bispora CBS 962.96]|uniref:Isoleucine--tRNA ligase, mitochondrial n=1 Tax=Dendrothele bispora (strain CBS 962.96) TaxID=1314807 RepID=A0A4V4HI04_DENBC|nr:isoleucyl-tRNA synthetase [Dendrothele bispora CBS 962.96]